MFEVDETGTVVRQIELYERGQRLRYHPDHPEDVYGSLSTFRLDVSALTQFRMDPAEFEQVWSTPGWTNGGAKSTPPAPGPAQVVIGPVPGRWFPVVGTALWMPSLLWGAFVALDRGVAGMLIAAALVVASVGSAVLTVRTWRGAVLVDGDVLVVRQILRTQRIAPSEVVEIIRTTRLGYPVLALQTRGGNAVHLPVVTQNSQPDLMAEQIAVLRRACGLKSTVLDVVRRR